MTPLHLAAERGRWVVLKHLVDQGADVHIQDQNGVKFICVTVGNYTILLT